MLLTANVRFGNLHCVTPTDPSGEDEPYLWVFFIRADGNTIRQRTNDPARLSANITVSSGPGRPGNLHVASVQNGGNIHIPPDVGEFSTRLKPIVLMFNQSGATFRLFLPGQIAAICFALDEDSTPRDVMESAFNDVKQLVERETNDFLNDMNLQTIAGGVITSPNPANAAQAIFTQQLTQLTDKIQKDAVSLVTKHIIMDIAANNEIWNFFGTAAKVADPDEPIGSARFSFTERDALNSTSSPFTADLRQSAAGLRGAWYTVQGSMDASASFVSTDLKSLTRPVISRPMGPPEDHVFQRNHPCVAAGTSVQTTRIGHTETYEISVEYPFLNYRYSIDGQALNGDDGTLVLSKEVHIPEFDEDTLRPASLFVKNHTATRQVRVTFKKQRPAGDRQIEQLLLSNDPRDGNYDLTLKVDAVSGGGKILPVGSVPIFFDGQEITLPAEFTKGIRGCLENFVGEKWAKSKQVTKRDLWGPVARRQRYDEVVRELDALAAVGAFEMVAIEAVKVDLARVLGLKQPLR